MKALSYKLIRLADAYAEHRNVKTWRVGHLAAGRGGFFENLRNGGKTSTERFETVLGWFSKNWPSDLDWPEDIPRPDVTTVPARGAPLNTNKSIKKEGAV